MGDTGSLRREFGNPGTDEGIARDAERILAGLDHRFGWGRRGSMEVGEGRRVGK